MNEFSNFWPKHLKIDRENFKIFYFENLSWPFLGKNIFARIHAASILTENLCWRKVKEFDAG